MIANRLTSRRAQRVGRGVAAVLVGSVLALTGLATQSGLASAAPASATAAPASTASTVTAPTPSAPAPTISEPDGTLPDQSNGSVVGQEAVVDPAVEVDAPLPTPAIDLHFGDGTGTTIVHEPDPDPGYPGYPILFRNAVAYAPGETRSLLTVLHNSGNEALRDVAITTITMRRLSNMSCSFPGDSTPTAAVVDSNGYLTATWEATTGDSPTVTWAVGGTVTCTSRLTVLPSDPPVLAIASAKATGVTSATNTSAERRYYAYTGSIQVINYAVDGPDPDTGPNHAGKVPAKPLANPNLDANTADTATIVTPAVGQGPSLPVARAVVNEQRHATRPR